MDQDGPLLLDGRMTPPTPATSMRMSAPPEPGAHPRSMGWLGTTALAMGGSNQSLFLIGALVMSQGSAAIPLLILGLLLSWAAAPGWTELVLMYPTRVGGIAATCAEAFRPYSPILANLTGTCYWWGWVPTCGLTAILSATAITNWYLPGVPVPALAAAIVLVFALVNLCGVRWVTRLAIPVATASAALAFLSGLIPLLSGHVVWRQATTYHLLSPFPGLFGGITSAMAGLYLVGFAAPAFEAAACHVGETVDPARNVPRAIFASGAMATVYFVALPIIWLGALGPLPLTGDLSRTLSPTFTPLLGAAGHAAAIWFMMFNMFHGTLQPLAGASRTLAQLSEDGLLPRVLSRRSRADAPWVATLLTAGMAIAFLLTGDPTWLIAAANLTYLIGICLPNVAVWLLRRDAPGMTRPYRAPRGTIALGLISTLAWAVATVLGFEQFGLPTVLAGLALAYSGSLFYGWRRWRDQRRLGVRTLLRSLHMKLTGAMLLVLGLDAAGYLLAVNSVKAGDTAYVTVLEDIFVAVAILTISVGLILPGMIGHAASEVAVAADRLATGTLADLSRAMQALGRGDLDAAHARAEVIPVVVHARDEMAAMARSFNTMQAEVAQAVVALDGAREGIRRTRDELAALGNTDPLTGLPNRALLRARLAASLSPEHAEQGVAPPLALLLLDLDRFKEVNDTLGHHYGDVLLQQVARRMQQVLRSSDTVARLGGDEFAILLCETDAAGAVHVATTILDALDASFDVEGHTVAVGVSIGIALYPAHGTDVATLLRYADMAMYAAKRTQSGHAVYTVEQETPTPHRLAWLGDLRQALARDALLLYYQPKVDLASGRVCGVEALLRWQHPEHGFIPPDQFIPLAEGSGLIVPLTEWVLESALRQCQRWSARGLALGIAVNLSARTLHDRGLPNTVARLLARFAVPPEFLTLELTESALMADPKGSLEVLGRLAELGVRISIDDFGTGYSSLGYLQHLPVHEVKIDRSFVLGMGDDAGTKSATIVRSVIALAHALGATVVAEGVETATGWDILAGLRCDSVQGYYISRPISAAELMTWARAWASTPRRASA